MHELLAEWEASADRRQRRRWLFSALIVSLCGAAVVAGTRWLPAAPLPAAPPTAAMVVELAPIPRTSPNASAQPTGKPQVEAPPPAPAEPEAGAEPKPKPEFDPEPVPEIRAPVPANVTLPKPIEKPVEKAAEKPERQPDKETVVQAPAPKTTAPPRQQAPLAETATSPRRSAPSAASEATRITFQQRLLEHLERHKRYPRLAQRKRMEGISYVRFAMDSQGKVLSARLEHSSGHPLLDDEALALLERSQPLPPIPQEIAEETLKIVVPVKFFLDNDW